MDVGVWFLTTDGHGAGGENRTRVASLEGWSFTTKLHPPTLRSGVGSKCETRGFEFSSQESESPDSTPDGQISPHFFFAIHRASELAFED